MDWIFVVFLLFCVFFFFSLERRNKTYAVSNTIMPSQFHKYPGHVPANTLVKATEACKSPPKDVEMLRLSLYQDLGLTSWTHIPSSLQEFVLLPCHIFNSAEALSRGWSLLAQWGWQGVKPLAPQPCHAAGPRRGLPCSTTLMQEAIMAAQPQEQLPFPTVVEGNQI